MRIRLRLVSLMVSLLGVAFSVSTLHAQTYANEDGAISGYDPVAYFTEDMPVKGKPEFSTDWNNATWYFSSAENKSMFDADPEKYAPQYGGFCAFGMSRGYAVSTEPDAWYIEDGKLYLNHNLAVRKTWLKDIPGYIEKANPVWAEKLETQVFE